MVTKFYLLESMGNEALASTQKKADELVASLKSGNLSVEQQNAVFDELKETIQSMGTVDVGTKESFSFFDSLKSMTSGKIDFGDQDTLLSNMQKLEEQSKSAKDSIDEAKISQLMMIDTAKQRYETMTYADTGLTVKQAFDLNFGEGSFDTLFNDVKEAAEKKAELDKKQIDEGYNIYLAMIEQQLEKNEKSYATAKIQGGIQNPADFLQEFGIFFKSMGRRDDIPGNEFFNQQTEDFENEYRKINSSIYDALNEFSRGVDLSQYYDVGANILAGMANGTIENAPDLYDSLSRIAEDGIEITKDTLEIESPSKVFYGIGEYIDEGLLLGIKSKENAVLNELADFNEKINSAIVIAPLDWSALMGETPEVDFSKVYTPSSKYSYYAQSSEPTRTEGYDVASVMEVAQLMTSAQDGAGIEFTIYTNVELDGETVGEAVSRRQDYTMRLSNGR